MLVRPVEIDEELAEGLQNGERGWRAVDELAVLAGGGDDALDDELIPLAGVQPALRERGIDFIQLLRLEYGLHGADFLPGADEVAVGPLSEHQFEGSHDDGLPRSRLASDPHQTRPELPREGINQREVLNREGSEHGVMKEGARRMKREKRWHFAFLSGRGSVMAAAHGSI